MSRFGTLELKGFQRVPGRETDAFHANVYVDGKKVGAVSNDGNGGCHRWEVGDNADWKRVEAAGETYREWSREKGLRTDWAEWMDHVADAIIDAQEDRKAALAAKRKGAKFLCYIAQSDEAVKESGQIIPSYVLAGPDDGEPEDVARSVIAEAEKALPAKARESFAMYDRLVVVMAHGEILDDPQMFATAALMAA